MLDIDTSPFVLVMIYYHENEYHEREVRLLADGLKIAGR
jgi:hypothetical protein